MPIGLDLSSSCMQRPSPICVVVTQIPDRIRVGSLAAGTEARRQRADRRQDGVLRAGRRHPAPAGPGGRRRRGPPRHRGVGHRRRGAGGAAVDASMTPLLMLWASPNSRLLSQAAWLSCSGLSGAGAFTCQPMLLPARQRFPEGRCKCAWPERGFTRDLLRGAPARWGHSIMPMAEHAALRGENCYQATRNLISTQSCLASSQDLRQRAADQLPGPDGILVTAEFASACPPGL